MGYGSKYKEYDDDFSNVSSSKKIQQLEKDLDYYKTQNKAFQEQYDVSGKTINQLEKDKQELAEVLLKAERRLLEFKSAFTNECKLSDLDFEIQCLLEKHYGKKLTILAEDYLNKIEYLE